MASSCDCSLQYSSGALIIPICLGVNFLMLITKTTRTVNIDLWNYWHFAFIGAVAYFVMGQSLLWGYSQPSSATSIPWSVQT